MHACKSRLAYLALIVASTLSWLPASLQADTLIYGATTDFTNINAGEVPYYSEAPDRNSLAIDAANVNYRDSFARATLEFSGNSGVYNVTLVALGELDGEGQYNLVINNEVVATAVNRAVTTDYEAIRHDFKGIRIAAGDTLGVESNATTNGKIPEGDGTAFARGRWTTLELAYDDAATTAPETVDLTLTSTVDKDIVSIGDSIKLTVTFQNRASSNVATNPLVTVQINTTDFSVVELANCTQKTNTNINTLSCPGVEAAPLFRQEVSLTLLALRATEATSLLVGVKADQQDSNLGDNTNELTLKIRSNDEQSNSPGGNSGSPGSTESVDMGNGTNSGSTTSNSARSGGGSLTGASLFIMLLSCAFLRWRRDYLQRRNPNLKLMPSNASNYDTRQSNG